MPQSATCSGFSRTGFPPLMARAAGLAIDARDNPGGDVPASVSAGVAAAVAAAAIDAKNSLRLTMSHSVEWRVFQPYSLHRPSRYSSLIATKLNRANSRRWTRFEPA